MIDTAILILLAALLAERAWQAIRARGRAAELEHDLAAARNEAERLTGRLMDSGQTIAELQDRLAAASPRTSDLTGRRVLVQLDTGHSLRGVVGDEYEDAQIIEHAEYVDGPSTQPVGTVTVPRARIAFTQVLGDQITPAPPAAGRIAA